MAFRYFFQFKVTKLNNHSYLSLSDNLNEDHDDLTKTCFSDNSIYNAEYLALQAQDHKLSQKTSSRKYLGFQEASRLIMTHKSALSLQNKSRQLQEMARSAASWGDPVLKVAAKNFPDDLDSERSPMTGYEIAIIQNVPLSSRNTIQSKKFKELAASEKWKSRDQLDMLMAQFWKNLIHHRRVMDELEILNENLNWLEKIIKISQNLYSNGKISQQALLELKIRKSELNRTIEIKKYDFAAVDEQMSYLLGERNIELDMKTVPWKILTRQGTAKG